MALPKIADRALFDQIDAENLLEARVHAARAAQRAGVGAAPAPRPGSLESIPALGLPDVRGKLRELTTAAGDKVKSIAAARQQASARDVIAKNVVPHVGPQQLLHYDGRPAQQLLSLAGKPVPAAQAARDAAMLAMKVAALGDMFKWPGLAMKSAPTPRVPQRSILQVEKDILKRDPRGVASAAAKSDARVQAAQRAATGAMGHATQGTLPSSAELQKHYRRVTPDDFQRTYDRSLDATGAMRHRPGHTPATAGASSYIQGGEVTDAGRGYLHLEGRRATSAGVAPQIDADIHQMAAPQGGTDYFVNAALGNDVRGVPAPSDLTNHTWDPRSPEHAALLERIANPRTATLTRDGAPALGPLDAARRNLSPAQDAVTRVQPRPSQDAKTVAPPRRRA